MRYRTELQVRWGDQDAYQHVNNVTYAVYLQEARTRMLAVGLRDTAAAGLLGILVVARLSITFARPLVYRPAPITAETWVGALSAATVTVECTLDDPDPNPDGPYCRGTVVLAPFDAAADRVRRLSDAERGALSAMLESEAPPAAR